MKKQVSLLILLLSASTLFAQNDQDTTYWDINGNTTVTFNQVSLTNWAAGGESSYSLNGLLVWNANYKKAKTSWENTLETGYGIVKIENEQMKKADDRLEISSKYGYQTGKYWYYTALLSFKTQYAEGYNYPVEGNRELISDFMSPAYILLSLGMDHKPTDNFSLLLSPITGKTTIVANDTLSAAGAFGVEPGKTIFNEYGGFIKTVYETNLMENVSFNTKLELFSAYNNEPQNIDINWESMVNMKINDYLSANIQLRLIYDDDIMIEDADGNTGPRTQFKEVFGLGFSYNF
ncbi:MAG: DUF3078 domain-containing protein [Bacteroidales bacterium]|nr:DUF3078 domain-containing protein [Bacteroidales bacterium]